jgi:hypothetical protein
MVKEITVDEIENYKGISTYTDKDGKTIYLGGDSILALKREITRRGWEKAHIDFEDKEGFSKLMKKNIA